LPLCALGALLALAGCEVTDPTELVVLVDTDLPIASQSGEPALAGELRSVRFDVECLAAEGDPPCRLRGGEASTFTGLEQSYEAAGLGARPPFYFVLRRDVAGVQRTFRITATAAVGPLDDAQTISSTVSAETVEGEARVVVLALREDCVDVMCADGTSCALGGGCGPIAQTAAPWPGSCAAVGRPGLAMAECEDDLFSP
jgi:hypothetical protein